MAEHPKVTKVKKTKKEEEIDPRTLVVNLGL